MVKTLLVDGNNLFKIGFHGVKDFYHNGKHIGGIYHFINTIKKFLSEKDFVFEKFYNPDEAFFVVPGSLPYYNLIDLTKIHSKDSLKVIQEYPGNLSEIEKNEIMDFLQ